MTEAAIQLSDYVRIPDAVVQSHLSRSTLYRLSAEKRIVLKKIRRSTFVDMSSIRAYLLDAATVH